MAGTSFWLSVRPATGRVLLLLALMVVVADADARGGRRGGGSRSSTSTSHSSNQDSGIHLNVRPRSGSSTSSSNGSPTVLPFQGGRAAASGTAAAPREALTPEEEARLAALVAASEREQAEKAAARQLAAEKAEAERIAAEQAVAARRSAEENARLAEQQKVQREKAAVDADVDRVLQRARADYPVLDTPEGEPLLARIKERQKALAATGMYPSVAMVRAIADNEYILRPAVKAPSTTAALAVAEPIAPAAPAVPAQSASFDGCRWVTPIQWSCK